METDPIDAFCKMSLKEATVFVKGNPRLDITPEDLFDAGCEILRRTSELKNGDEAEVYAKGLISTALILCNAQVSKPDEEPKPQEIVKKIKPKVSQGLRPRKIKCVTLPKEKVKGQRAWEIAFSLLRGV